jgi:cell division septal protein FtsQ
MFQNKKKVDSKIRFQNSRFKHRLEQARGYKRQIRNKPLGKSEIFLSKIGLGSWLSRFITLLVFFILIYLTFIPNFFFVKHITINGLQAGDKFAAETLINSYLSKELPWPQKNLILLSKNGLKNFLVKNDQKILDVTAVNKKFPSTLIVNLVPRVDQFLIQTASSTNFSVADDGVATAEIFSDASDTLPTGLTLVKLDDSEGLIINKKALSQNQLTFLNQSQSQLPSIVKSPIGYYELASLQAPDFTVYLKSGFKLLFSFGSDGGQALNRLKLLFSQFADSDLKNLYYVDMRFGDNGYVCYKGAPCVQNISLPEASTTTTNLSN